jgi:hypothetical protein
MSSGGDRVSVVLILFVRDEGHRRGTMRRPVSEHA